MEAYWFHGLTGDFKGIQVVGEFSIFVPPTATLAFRKHVTSASGH